MTENEKELAVICNDPEISSLWNPEIGDKVVWNKCIFFVSNVNNEQGYPLINITNNRSRWINKWKRDFIWLPSLSRIIAEIENFSNRHGWEIERVYKKTEKLVVEYRTEVSLKNREVIERGATPELACVKALKQVLDGGK